MTKEELQAEPEFTKNGALLGLVSYIVVALIIAWVFCK